MGRTVILVHGTFAAPKPGVTQWYEGDPARTDSFAGRVEATLRAAHDSRTTVWRHFTWSGKNEHQEREKAAAALCDEITRVRADSPDEEVCLIAHSHGGNVALKALEIFFRGGAEASKAFDRLLRALGAERLNADGAAARVATEYRIPNSPLQRFVKRAADVLMLLVRLHRMPPLRASEEEMTQWVARMRRAYLIRWMVEPFCLRWNAQRRPRLQLITMGTPFFQKSWLELSGQMRTSRIIRFFAGATTTAAAIYCAAAAVAAVLSLARVNLAIPVSPLWLAVSVVVLVVFTSTV